MVGYYIADWNGGLKGHKHIYKEGQRDDIFRFQINHCMYYRMTLNGHAAPNSYTCPI